jgi:hypothetical protein
VISLVFVCLPLNTFVLIIVSKIDCGRETNGNGIVQFLGQYCLTVLDCKDHLNN